jgi:hypothetical protein
MFIKKVKDRTSETSNDEGFLFISKGSGDKGDSPSKDVPPSPLFTKSQQNAFMDKAKELLTYMERNLKINIYDDSRYPGMYLRNSINKNQKPPMIFNNKTKVIEENENNTNDIINFFKNGQKR